MTILSQVLSVLFVCLFASPAQPFDEYQGLGHVKILKALPAGDATSALRWADFHYGVIDNAADWKPVARALNATGAIDWDAQAVVYVILAEQTNQLDFQGIAVDSKGHATFSFEWIGIEPFYVDHMPVLFKVVNRADMSDLTFRTDSGDTLGTVQIQPRARASVRG